MIFFLLRCFDPPLTYTFRLGLEMRLGGTSVKVLDIEKYVYIAERGHKGTKDVKVPTWTVICRLQSSHPNVKVSIFCNISSEERVDMVFHVFH